MDSRRFDVIVVGAGISGLTAACAAASRDRKVALVTTGPGSFVLGSGRLRTQELTQPGAAHETAHAIEFFREMAKAAGCPFEGDIAAGRSLPTVLGEFEKVALASRSQWNADPRNACPTAIVGIRGLSCFDANFIAERLSENAGRPGVTCNYHARQISITQEFAVPPTTLRLATRFDRDPGFRSELAGALRAAASGFERVLVPAILGLNSSAQQISQFEREVGSAVCELPTLPPSISGLRLLNRLLNYLHEIGVELFEGYPVTNLGIEDRCCTRLEIASPGHQMILRGEFVVLASGRRSGQELCGASSHDQQMRPLTSAGSLVACNLIDVNSNQRDEVKVREPLMGILRGYRAGILAAETGARHVVG